MKLTRNALCGGLITTLLAVASAGALAQDPVKLRVADSLPGKHQVVRYLKDWMDQVSKATGGQVQFEYFGSEQLGKAKDLLSLTLNGVADIGYVAPSYVSDKLPLSGVGDLPGEFTSSCQGTQAYWKLGKPGGALDRREFQPNGVRLLFTVLNVPYQVYTSSRKIEDMKSFAGLKLRTSGGAMDLTAAKMGAAPVRMAGPQVYEGLSRGTLDGLIFPPASLFAYDLQGLLKYATVGENFGSFAYSFMISENRWRRLSPAAQNAMRDAGENVVKAACEDADREAAAALDKLKQAGVALVRLPDADHKQMQDLLAPTRIEWAKELDRRGKAGTEILNAFTQALKSPN